VGMRGARWGAGCEQGWGGRRATRVLRARTAHGIRRAPAPPPPQSRPHPLTWIDVAGGGLAKQFSHTEDVGVSWSVSPCGCGGCACCVWSRRDLLPGCARVHPVPGPQVAGASGVQVVQPGADRRRLRTCPCHSVRSRRAQASSPRSERGEKETLSTTPLSGPPAPSPSRAPLPSSPHLSIPPLPRPQHRGAGCSHP
jgi:hypothetical protein